EVQVVGRLGAGNRLLPELDRLVEAAAMSCEPRLAGEALRGARAGERNLAAVGEAALSVVPTPVVAVEVGEPVGGAHCPAVGRPAEISMGEPLRLQLPLGPCTVAGELSRFRGTSLGH